MATEHFSFRPTQEDLRMLKEYSQQTGMTMSDIVRRSLRLAGPALVKGMQVAAAEIQPVTPCDANPERRQ